MPKERTRERPGQKEKRSGHNNRRERGEQVRETRGDTRIEALRQIYGDTFAPGIRGDAHLKTLLDRTGSESLSDYLETCGQSLARGKARKERANEEVPQLRYASDQRFAAAHRKTSTLHAGLFRRLAE